MDMNNAQQPTTAPDTMYYVLHHDTTPVGFFKNVTADEDNVWTWTGLHREARALPLSPGLYVTYCDPQTLRWNRLGEVVKVNRVTFTVRDDVTGEIIKIEVPR